MKLIINFIQIVIIKIKFIAIIMKEVFKNDFVVLNYDEQTGILHVHFRHNCGNLLDENNLQAIDELRPRINQLNPIRLIADMSECDYHLTPTSKTWFDTPLFSFFSDLEIKKIAIILPGNMWVTASFDAYRADEGLESGTSIQYFREVEKAWRWIKA
jgi:hypothetical protein